MKIAVIDHFGNPGGGSRVVRALLPAIKTVRPDIDITFFGNKNRIIGENLHQDFIDYNIEIRTLSSVDLKTRGFFSIKGSSVIINAIQEKYNNLLSKLPAFLSGETHKEIERLVTSYDLAFFTWPYFLSCPKLNCPMVGIFHDFNYKYYFSGSHVLNRNQINMFNRDMPIWFSRSIPVVSTYFMASEIKKFFPEWFDKVRIVHLAPFTRRTIINTEEAIKNIQGLGIKKKYVLCPTNICSHKNIGPLLSSINILNNKMGQDLSLVLTGPGTEIINGHATEIGIEMEREPSDVMGLGYVTNIQIDSLIQCASVVVNTSLYEAGNGSGLDAWEMGTPVAMSNIPSFMEHLEFQGLFAEVFDPRNPLDIAEKIYSIIHNKAKAEYNVRKSLESIKNITWENTAIKYIDIFEEEIYKKNRNHRMEKSKITK